MLGLAYVVHLNNYETTRDKAQQLMQGLTASQEYSSEGSTESHLTSYLHRYGSPSTDTSFPPAQTTSTSIYDTGILHTKYS